jgi:hypothetical protein
MAVSYYHGKGEQGGARPFPALVAAVAQGAPDFGLHLVVFREDGSAFPAWRPPSIATWTAAGADPKAPYWDYVDLS